MKNIITILQGVVIGIGQVIPGASGSTLAMIMGVYDDFIELLHSATGFLQQTGKFITRKITWQDLITEFKKINLQFGIFLAIGIAISFVLFANLVSYLLDHYIAYLYSFLTGLILFSISITLMHVKTKGLKSWGLIALVAILMYGLLSILDAKPETVPALWLGPVIGFMTASAAAVPGIDGTFILIVFGVYDFCLKIIKHTASLQFDNFEITFLALFLIGVLAGLASISRFMKWALKNHSSMTMTILTGLMIGSIKTTNPLQFALAPNTNLDLFLRFGFFLLAGGIILFLRNLSIKKGIEE